MKRKAKVGILYCCLHCLLSSCQPLMTQMKRCIHTTHYDTVKIIIPVVNRRNMQRAHNQRRRKTKTLVERWRGCYPITS